jgi:hypothetical protein
MKARLLFAFVAGFALAGCNSTGQISSIRERALEQLVAATPLGMRDDEARAAIVHKGWAITSDRTTNWPSDFRHKPDIDKVYTISLPWHHGIPFSIEVYGYVGIKDSKVVNHAVVADFNAL